MASEKILVVEDSRDTLDMIVKFILTPNGYSTLEADNGVIGL